MHSYHSSYTDRNEGPQVYTLLPSPPNEGSSLQNAVKVVTASRHKTAIAKPQTDAIGEKESSNLSAIIPRQQELASLPVSSSLKHVLRFCLKASHNTRSIPLYEDELQAAIPFSLHPYQVKGVQWLLTLYSNGQNGILADEMGLGKTVQVLSFIAYLHHLQDMQHSQISLHCLIVVPTSLVYNWKSEIETWCKGASVVVYRGKPEEVVTNPSAFSIFLTT